MADNGHEARPVQLTESDGFDRLMHGERSESRSAEDCNHWIEQYRELLNFKKVLLTEMDEHLRALSRPASAEIQELDVGLIEMQRRRYQRRLAFWLNRQKEVGGIGAVGA